ncbi:MAG TPA: glycoside hydrolase family 6 protein [Gemmatimonadaceae bacterium]|nr:glycoside hydrolase family 6 protein [Gemmatimonadaceae bacterium]
MKHLRISRLSARTFAVVVTAILSACGDAVAPTYSDSASGDVSGSDARKPSASPISNPLLGSSLWVPSWSRARITADQWRSTRPSDAALMDKLAEQAQAQWFGNWNADVRSDVSAVVSSAIGAGAVPVLVAYNIPLRDCGSFSSGGAASADAYRSWINAYADGLAGRKAIVVLEPDALAGMGCLSAGDQATRVSLLRYAVERLRDAGGLVYLDAGNNRWQSVSTIASRLKNAGIELATGFALNVSNFFSTAEETSYGDAISAAVGGKHYVLDTSRNGLGATADAQWCNPEGRAVGSRPTSFTGRPLVDAYLWVKVPGESDGSCNGYPSSGTWLPEYALGLAQRASW